jgi:hypothetical protein
MRSVTVLAVVALFVAPAAAAKEFEPGDLRVCNSARCVPITDRPALRALGLFYYTGTARPQTLPTPRLGTSAFELRFRNGYVTGIVGGRELGRFLSYGVNVGWFRAGRWYRVPDVAANELRRLTAGLKPLLLTRARLDRSR